MLDIQRPGSGREAATTHQLQRERDGVHGRRGLRLRRLPRRRRRRLPLLITAHCARSTCTYIMYTLTRTACSITEEELDRLIGAFARLAYGRSVHLFPPREETLEVPVGRGKPAVLVDKNEILDKFDPVKLKKLRPTFKDNSCTVTAGNASVQPPVGEICANKRKSSALPVLHVGKSEVKILSGCVYSFEMYLLV